MSRSDRPWTRHLIRVAVRLLLGGKRAHVQDRFPCLFIDPDDQRKGFAKLYFKKRFICDLVSFTSLKERADAEIHIIGSGPSIREMDLHRLPPRSAILLNGAISLLGQSVPEPLAVAIEDERFIFRHFDGMVRNLAPNVPCLFSVAVLRAICQIDRDWLRRRHIILIDNILKPYGKSRLAIGNVSDRAYVVTGDDGVAGLSLDPDNGVFQGGSVAISAMQFAIACRPALIGLLGIDISNAGSPRFYESDGKTAFSGIASSETKILCYFAIARTICDAKDISLQCYSSQSALLKIGYAYSDRFSLQRQG